MDGIAKPALDAVSAFPLIQAALGILILLGGLYIMTRGQRDNANKPPELVPSWLMMGPLHDMMQSVHEVAEQGRHQTDLLRRIDDQMGDLLRQTEMTKATLEAIRNESRMR